MKIQQNPTSKALFVHLPKAIVEAINWKKGDRLTARIVEGNRLIMTNIDME